MNIAIKKWFTLIEIMLVIVVIGILMVATMSYSWEQLTLLREKSVQERFIDQMNMFSRIALSSHYFQDKTYSEILLSFKVHGSDTHDAELLSKKKHDTWIGYLFSWGGYATEQVAQSENMIDPWYTVLSLSSFSSRFSELVLKYTPYTLWCQVFLGDQKYVWDTDILFTIGAKKHQKFCSRLNIHLCKFEKISCDTY